MLLVFIFTNLATESAVYGYALEEFYLHITEMDLLNVMCLCLTFIRYFLGELNVDTADLPEVIHAHIYAHITFTRCIQMCVYIYYVMEIA